MANYWSFRGKVFLTDAPESDDIAFDLIRAFEPAEVDGSDWNVPRRPGLVLRDRFAKRRIIIADGRIRGTGSTRADRYTSLATSRDAAMTVLAHDLPPGQLVAYTPYWGIAADRYLDARCIRVIPGEIVGAAFPLQKYRLEFECVSNPPNWSTYTAITLATSAAADDILDTTAPHGLAVGDRIVFTALTGGTGLSVGTVYYVIAGSLAAQTFKVSTTEGGGAFNFSSDVTAGTVVVYARAI